VRWQWILGLVLAILAVALLARDLRRAGNDPFRRPVSLLMASLVVVILAGTHGGRLPDPWWLVLPASVLAWEAARGWRTLPRCHLREGGMGAWAAGLALAAAGLGLKDGGAVPLLAAAAIACVLGVFLMWRSRRREPSPFRPGDAERYERRTLPR